MADFYIRQDTITPVLRATITDDQGNPVNLTDATIMFVMASILDYEVKVQAAADVLVSDPADLGDDEPNVRYRWVEGDTDTPGVYRAEWQVTYGDGSTESFPNTGYLTVQVTEKLA